MPQANKAKLVRTRDIVITRERLDEFGFSQSALEHALQNIEAEFWQCLRAAVLNKKIIPEKFEIHLTFQVSGKDASLPTPGVSSQNF